MKNLPIGLLCGLLLMIACSPSQAALWQDVDSNQTKQYQFRGTAASAAKQNQIPRFEAARLLDLDVDELQDYLALAPTEGSHTHALSIELPLPYGEFAEYLIYHSPVMAPALAAKFPEISTYKVIERDNPSNTGRLDFTPAGFHAVLSYYGSTVYIDPLGDKQQYQSYFKTDYARHKAQSGQRPAFRCNAAMHQTARRSPVAMMLRSTTPDGELSYGSQLKIFRLAVATTGEFNQFHGGTKALGMAALATGINRINEIYERDLAIRLELVANNDKIIYVDPDTDPFDPAGNTDLSDQVVAVIDQEIGSDNFDVGHVIHGEGVGGQAGYAVACDPFSKAVGETASDEPINDAFFIDFVAHELGHQFGATHSFNAMSGACVGNRMSENAYEPGSGSTIMGYAGICGDENLQLNSDAYFHSDSLAQIRSYLDTDKGGCGVPTGATNSIPVSDAGDADITHYLPIQTPFELSGSATDADGDTLIYTWEQLDTGPATASQAAQTDDGQRPIFRSFPPTLLATRVFPQLDDILSNSASYGELLPTTSRDLNFRLTVRDGSGGVASAKRLLKTSASAGPFIVTLADDIDWQGATQSVTWDVANTSAAPLSCSAVKISLSTDGGNTFPIVLLENTANVGSAEVTLPVVSTTSGRIKVSCVSQPFFALNSNDMRIENGGSGAAALKLQLRAVLQGAYMPTDAADAADAADAVDGLMRDSLQQAGLLPSLQPFGEQHTVGSTVINEATSTLSAGDAPVDWVLVGLIAADDPTNTLAASAAILQRDGDIVDPQSGLATLEFPGIAPGNYAIGLRHRNHLAVMTADPVALSENVQAVDFSSPALNVLGNNARYLANGVAMLWSGDADANNRIIASGPGNDGAKILERVLSASGNAAQNANYRLSGYFAADFNLDGQVLFAGPNNDSNMIISNVLLHPGNTNAAINFIVNGQRP